MHVIVFARDPRPNISEIKLKHISSHPTEGEQPGKVNVFLSSPPEQERSSTVLPSSRSTAVKKNKDMPRISSRQCCPGRRYATRNRRSAPTYQVPQPGEQTLSILSRKLWAGRAEFHRQKDVSPDEKTSNYDEEYSTADTSTTTTAGASITTTAGTTTSSAKPSSTRGATAFTSGINSGSMKCFDADLDPTKKELLAASFLR